jgi:hypothetical protein
VEYGSVDVNSVVEESRKTVSDEENRSIVEVPTAEEETKDNDELACSVSVEVSVEVSVDVVMEEGNSVVSAEKEINEEGFRDKLSEMAVVAVSGPSEAVDPTVSD